LYVVEPDRGALDTVDVHAAKVVRSTPGLSVVTGIALDADSHLVYLSHLNGEISIVDGARGQIISRLELSDVGLTGIATAQGRVYAINTPGRELLVLDVGTDRVSHIPLTDEPTAIVAGPQSGSAYVLEGGSNVVVRVDPGSGTELGRVSLGQPDAGGGSLAPGLLWLRPRMAISAQDETVYVIEPETGTLAVSPSQL
jgi:DNA-binding beta-propeller fold protein YncE